MDGRKGEFMDCLQKKKYFCGHISKNTFALFLASNRSPHEPFSHPLAPFGFTKSSTPIDLSDWNEMGANKAKKAFVKAKKYVLRQKKDYVGGATC